MGISTDKLIAAADRFVAGGAPPSGVGDVLIAGEALLARFTTSRTEEWREAIWRWLEGCRRDDVLVAVSAAGRGERWFSLVVEIIAAMDLTVGELVRQRARKYKDRPLFLTLQNEQIIQHSWSDVAQRIENIARGLLSLDTGNTPVIFLCKNSLETALCDLACLTHGLVNAVVPVNIAGDSQRVRQERLADIIRRTRAGIAIVSDSEQLAAIVSADTSDALRYIVLLNPGMLRTLSSTASEERIIAFDRLHQLGATHRGEFPHPAAGDLATIMYTSGTTGEPKGIPFTHTNLVSKRFARSLALPFVGENDVLLCYLPLYHTFGRWLEMLGTVFWGGRYVFAQSPSTKTLLENMRRVRATGFISVPLKWIQIREEAGRQFDLEGAPDSEVKKELQQRTGGRLRWGLSAAGRLDEDDFLFYQRMGVELMSGFGMTEATGGITMTPPGGYRPGTVGKALPGIELRREADGELLVRGPYVVDGYYGADGEAEATLTDGWLHTGDIVTVDPDGYATIVDRKKDMYKNLKGETVAPQRIESFFTDFPGVSQAFLVGDQRPFNTLLIVPDMDDKDSNLREMSSSELKEFFRPYVISVNRFLSRHERVVDYTILKSGFLVDTGELTPKGTFRRQTVVDMRKGDIEPMYRRKYLNVEVGGTRLRVPHWFLREKGVTESDVVVDGDRLILRSTNDSLTICRGRVIGSHVRIGSLAHACESRVIDLDRWLRAASLWVGNGDLVAFAGNEIAHWRSSAAPAHVSVNSEVFHPVSAPLRSFPSSVEVGRAGTLMDLHAAACILANSATGASRDAAALYAVEHLRKVCARGTYEFASLAKQRLAWGAHHPSFAVRSLAYRSLLSGEMDSGDDKHFRAFVDSGKPFLDAGTIDGICEDCLDDMQLSALRSRLETYRNESAWPLTPSRREQFRHIIELLLTYGISHPETYATIRSELASWLLLEGDPLLRQTANCALENLTAVHRSRLLESGHRGTVPDPEGLFEFELGIDDKEKTRIQRAFEDTSLLPETIQALFDGKRIVPEDLARGSVWISQRGGRFGSLLYHTTVETNSGEIFEFDLALNRSQLEEHFRTTELLRARCSDLPNRPPGLARLGGLWADIGIATREDVAGESLMDSWKRVSRLRPDALSDDIRWECIHHLRLALAACIEFWSLTGSTWMLFAPSPRDVVVSTGHTTRQVRLFNIADRVLFSNVADFAMALYRGIYHPLWHECPPLRMLLDPAHIYEAFVEVLGECETQLAFEKAATAPRLHERLDGSTVDAIHARFRDLQTAIRNGGFRPFALREAVHDYRRWLALNPRATAEARLANISGSYRWHNLRETERRWPEARLRLFQETLWMQEGSRLGPAIDAAIQTLRGKRDVHHQILRLVSELRMDHQLSEEDNRYLTWLSYPHLTPDHRARLVPLRPGDDSVEPLSTTLTDATGDLYEFRDASSPREVARLTWLMRQSGLSIVNESDHQIQVALDSRGVIVGGLIYRFPAPHRAWIHSLIVASSLRDRHLGRAIVEDFLSRLSGQDVRVVTVDFVLPEFWTELGFKPNAEYGGLTKILVEG